MNAIPEACPVNMLQLGEIRVSKKHEPICVSGTNAEAEGGGEVNPEMFPEFSSDGSDGHLVRGGRGRW